MLEEFGGNASVCKTAFSFIEDISVSNPVVAPHLWNMVPKVFLSVSSVEEFW